MDAQHLGNVPGLAAPEQPHHDPVDWSARGASGATPWSLSPPGNDEARRQPGFWGQGKEDRVDSAAPVVAAQPSQPPSLTNREHRALMALLAEPLTREQLDRTAGCSNGPDLMMNLRRKLGLKIECQMQDVEDRDGRVVKRGRYVLTDDDQLIARAALRSHVEGGAK